MDCWDIEVPTSTLDDLRETELKIVEVLWQGAGWRTRDEGVKEEKAESCWRWVERIEESGHDMGTREEQSGVVSARCNSGVTVWVKAGEGAARIAD